MANGYGWGDEITATGDSGTLLEEGEYRFTVTEFQRGRVERGKNAGANQAVYTLHVEGAGGASKDIKYFITLTDSMRWKATQFFKAIGQIPADTSEGDDFRPEWDRCIGSTGMAEVYVRKFTGDDGRERETNDVSRVFAAPAQQAAPAGGYGSL
ncbi:MAG: hypothetical protein SOY67_02705 [Collinsella sp.]|nr:hypothetical protein [Collinsella sp.]